MLNTKTRVFLTITRSCKNAESEGQGGKPKGTLNNNIALRVSSWTEFAVRCGSQRDKESAAKFAPNCLREVQTTLSLFAKVGKQSDESVTPGVNPLASRLSPTVRAQLIVGSPSFATQPCQLARMAGRLQASSQTKSTSSGRNDPNYSTAQRCAGSSGHFSVTQGRRLPPMRWTPLSRSSP